jgi:hypothetical protein
MMTYSGSAQMNSTGAMPSPTGGSIPLIPMLETFIPGLSLFTNFLNDYLKIDVTQYLWGILVVLALTTAVNYATDKISSYWNRYLVSTAEINYTDEVYK